MPEPIHLWSCISCKQWEDVVGHALTFDWQRRQSWAESCAQSLMDNPFLEMLQAVAAQKVPAVCGLHLLQQSPGKLLPGSAARRCYSSPFECHYHPRRLLHKIPMSQDPACRAGPWASAPSPISADQQYLFYYRDIKGPWVFLGNISCSSQCRVYCQTPTTAPFSLCGCPAKCPRVVWQGWEIFHQPCPEAVCSWSWKIELKQWVEPTM